MLFDVLLYTSLIIFILGLIFKFSTWFSSGKNIFDENINTSEKISAAIKGISGTVFSPKIVVLLQAFILDVLLQKKILEKDILRWLMHMLIFYGFMLLLLMHAMDEIVSTNLFSGYYSTVNPYFFLRDFFFIMVMAGLLLAVYRRFILKIPRLRTNNMDIYAIVIVAVIIISGVALEGMKIVSHSDFIRMAEEYGVEDEDELKALESYWVKEFGVVSPNVQKPFEKEILEQGKDSHTDNCADCHSSTVYAFAGYATSIILTPVAISLDKAGFVNILYYLHILACFIGLAYLPFSKMFHIITTPLSLLVNAVMYKKKSNPLNIATRQAMEPEACTHCGTCSINCSAMMMFEALGNEYILPSEKMAFLKTLSKKKKLHPTELKAILTGIHACTNCDRCTDVCPSGINLKELWLNFREILFQKGVPEPLVLTPFSFVRGINRKISDNGTYSKPIKTASKAVSGNFDSLMNTETTLNVNNRSVTTEQVDNTFINCFGCQNCTTVCPAVGNCENPEKELGLLPHQIMCSLELGLKEMAQGAPMLWSCLSCYQCQEHCPQNVKVTDLLFELKNLAVKNIGNASGENSPDINE